MIFFVISGLLLRQILAQTDQQLQITLIHDDSIDLYNSKESMDICIRTIIENLKSQYRNPVSINFVAVSPTTNFNTELIRYKDDENRTKGFIILADCQVAEVIIHHLRTLMDNPNILFLDYLICQPLKKSESFHLQAFRLNDDIRPGCVQYTIHRWMEQTVYSFRLEETTKKTLNLNFSADIILGECNQYHDSNPSTEIYLPNSKAEENYIRHFLNKKHLIVASIEDPPSTYFHRSSLNSSIITYRGISFDYFYIMQQYFNFTYTVSVPEFGTYGVPFVNGSWNGIMGMVANGKGADVGIQSVYVTEERNKVVDFVSFGNDPMAILIPTPAPDESLFSCIKPFQINIWLCLVTVLAVLPFIIWIYMKTHNSFTHESSEVSLTRIYIFVFRVLMFQSNGIQVPENDTFLAYLLILWSFVAVILSNLYQGLVMSSTLVPKFEPVIRSIEDLPKPSVKIIVWKGTAAETLIQGADERDGVFWRIKQNIAKYPELLLESETEIRRLVENKDHVAIYCLSTFKYLIEKQFSETKECSLSLAANTFRKPSSVGFIVRKGSPLMTIFNKKTLQIAQSGLQHYLSLSYQKKMSAENVCKNLASSKKKQTLAFHDLRGAFLILAIGMGFACVAFFIELIHYMIIVKGIRLIVISRFLE